MLFRHDETFEVCPLLSVRFFPKIKMQFLVLGNCEANFKNKVLGSSDACLHSMSLPTQLVLGESSTLRTSALIEGAITSLFTYYSSALMTLFTIQNLPNCWENMYTIPNIGVAV